MDSVLIDWLGEVDDFVALLDETLGEGRGLDVVETVAGAEEDLLLTVLHTLEVVLKGSWVFFVVGGDKSQEFGQTGSVSVIFDNTELDAKIFVKKLPN